MRNQFKVFPWLSFFVFIAIIFASCSKKTSIPHMAYHDVTMRYNYYFNAKLILNQTIKNLRATHENKYNEILDLYRYMPAEEGQSLNAEMNTVIKKASIGVQLHENSKWVDDAYLLIGKSEFLKENYEGAVQAFQVITAEYDAGVRQMEPSGVRKRRFQKERKDETLNVYYDPFTSFLKHKPARWESLIWIIRSYSQMERFVEAQSIISYAQGDKTFPDELKGPLEVAITDYYLKKGEYTSAANSLKKAILLTRDKERKTRYTFILAQIYQHINQHNLAIENFQEVIKHRPDYEMEFYAKINIANISRDMRSTTNTAVIALLKEMLENDKYRMFKGQIYYSLAEIYLNEDRSAEAVTALKQSAQHSTENPTQKTQAYLKLADIYFEREAYLVSKAYHDSTLALLSSENPAYETINLRKMVLEDLANQVQVIELQDSLQKLAGMTDAELQEILDERKRQEQQLLVENTYDPFQTNNPQSSIVTNWPFDNPGSRSSGYSEFVRIWGNRPIQDNWRRAEAGALSSRPDTEDGDDASFEDDPTTLSDLKSQLPLTPDQIQSSNEEMIDAYYSLSNIYRNRLDNETKSAETLEELMARFPINRFRNEAAYRLYLYYQDIDPAKANSYKNIVLTEYPESTLAKIIQNPNHLEASREEEQNINNFYASTFTMFEEMQYSQVVLRVGQSDTLFPENHMRDKFDMLNALSLGKMGYRDSFKSALQKIVNKYPQSEVSSRAMDILHLMEGSKYGDDVGVVSNYKYRPEKQHHVMIVFNEITEINEQVKGNLSNYNTQNHEPENLKINSLLLDNNTQLILIKSFVNADKAESYYSEIRYSEKIFPDTESEAHQVFVISEYNFGVFFREKNIPEYMKFFSDNYLNN